MDAAMTNDETAKAEPKQAALDKLLTAARAVFTTPGYVEARGMYQNYVAKTALAGLRDALAEFPDGVEPDRKGGR